jgi:hypothetical protein
MVHQLFESEVCRSIEAVDARIAPISYLLLSLRTGAKIAAFEKLQELLSENKG